MKKRTKKYHPRKVRLDITALMLNGDEPVPEHQRAMLLMAVHASASALVKGDAPRQDWHTLVSALNVTQLMCEKAGNAHVGLEIVAEAQNAMIAVGERCHRVGRLGVTGDEMQAINAGLDLYERLLEIVTKRQYAAAIEEGMRRLEAGDVVKLKREGTQRMTAAGLAA